MVLRVIVERLRIITCRRTRSVDAIRRKDLSSSAGLFWRRVSHLTVALIVRDFGFAGHIRLVVQFVALRYEYVLGVRCRGVGVIYIEKAPFLFVLWSERR
jgi:hypothetical protein